MEYLRIINNIISGDYDDMYQAFDDRDIYFIRLELLDNLYANMLISDQNKYCTIIVSAIKIVSENL